MNSNFYIDKSSIVTNTVGNETSKVYKACRVDNTILGENATIGDYSRIFNSKLGDMCAIQRNAMMFSTEFGRYSYTGKNFTSWYCKIGSFCSISWNVSIGGANHDYTRGTTHSMLYSADFGMIDKNEPVYDRFSDECEIGNDVWLAANACVCRGVKIGDGAVVAAGAVVTHDVEPYSIVAGVPARQLKKRFSNDIIEILLEAKWWDFPAEVIKENIQLLGSKMDLKVAKEILKIRKKIDEGEL